MDDRWRAILSGLPKKRGGLLGILHRVQDEFGYISLEAVRRVAEHVGASPAQVYGTLTFYSEFRIRPPARHVIQICHCPACHLSGSDQIERIVAYQRERGCLKGVEVELRVEQCGGICGFSPVIRVDGKVYTRVALQDVTQILEELKAG